MAIILTGITRRSSDLYLISVQDTETGAVLTAKYNPATGRDALKRTIEDGLIYMKETREDEASIEADIKATVEAINPATLTTQED